MGVRTDLRARMESKDSHRRVRELCTAKCPLQADSHLDHSLIELPHRCEGISVVVVNSLSVPPRCPPEDSQLLRSRRLFRLTISIRIRRKPIPILSQALSLTVSSS